MTAIPRPAIEVIGLDNRREIVRRGEAPCDVATFSYIDRGLHSRRDSPALSRPQSLPHNAAEANSWSKNSCLPLDFGATHLDHEKTASKDAWEDFVRVDRVFKMYRIRRKIRCGATEGCSCRTRSLNFSLFSLFFGNPFFRENDSR